MATDGSLRINADLAIYFDGESAKFRPGHRDRVKVFDAVLRWEEENVDHPRRAFVAEWIQSFELPERQISSLSAEAEFLEAFSKAKSFRHMKNILAEYKMKNGIPEPQARMEAESEIDELLNVARRKLRGDSDSESPE